VSTKTPVPWWMPRPSRWSQYVALVLVVVAIVVAVTIGKRTYDTMMAYPDRPGPGSSDPIALEVPAGASFPQVLDLLVQHGVIPEDEAMYFKVYVLHRGAARKTTAGPHTFRGDMTAVEIVEELARQQKAEETSVTIPEGKNILEIAQLLADAGLSDTAALEAAMRDPKLLEELQIPGQTVEGYLFPDTYRFATSAPPREIVRRMVERHRKVFAGLRRRYRTEAQNLERDLEWSDHEIVTLASIVEKETAAKHERPLIAGVFLNRLKFSSFKPKLLQTDPTIVYGCTVPEKKSAACEKFEGRIRTIHLRDQDNPYSTYAHEGLPPGPISNPGKEALESVFAPKKSRFLYFVSRNDGTHQFSKTVAEHEAYVDEYQRKNKVGDGSAAGAADGG
jgi:UPF0755 protein